MSTRYLPTWLKALATNPENQANTLRVIVGSKNPVKVGCTREAFSQAFGNVGLVEGVDALSNIPAQPRSEEETLLGAKNRATHAKSLVPEADYWVGIEGGVDVRLRSTREACQTFRQAILPAKVVMELPPYPLPLWEH
jgi:non-canonical (house-cleaning) NTP pyrophosphatase